MGPLVIRALLVREEIFGINNILAFLLLHAEHFLSLIPLHQLIWPADCMLVYSTNALAYTIVILYP